MARPRYIYARNLAKCEVPSPQGVRSHTAVGVRIFVQVSTLEYSTMLAWL